MSYPSVLGIHHINLTVTDPERSSEWYRSVLGLEPGWEMPDVEGRGRKVILLFPNSDLRLVLTQHQINTGEKFAEFVTGLDHLALSVSSREDLDSWVTRLDSLMVEHSEIKEGATGWLITVRDPDNIQLELYTVSK